MKKFNVLLIALVLMMSMVFVGCDMFGGDDGTTTYTLSANDGFELVSATVAFSTSSSVAELDPEDLYDTDADVDYTERYYAPTDLAELEDGDAPVISFTFSEDLRDSELEAVFSFLNSSISITTNSGSAYTNTFFDMDSDEPLDAFSVGEGETVNLLTDVSVSGNTVSFTFEEDTFSIDNDYLAAFGVVSEAGEAYTVVTSFTPQANIIDQVDIVPNYDAWYAYAIDSDRMYYLGLATEGTHWDDATIAEQLLGASYNAGQDFGTAINSLLLRATSTTSSSPTDGTYAHLLELYTNGNFVEYIPYDLTFVDYASGYTFYHVDGEGYETEVKSISLLDIALMDEDDYIYEDETADEDELVVIGATIDVPVYDFVSVVTGDEIVCIPSNSRGEFDDCSDSSSLTDNIHPFRASSTNSNSITMTTATTNNFAWAGVDYTNDSDSHNHDTSLAASEGHLVSFGTWYVNELTGWSDTNMHEGLVYTMAQSGLTASYSGTSAGSQKVWSEADVREELDLDDDVTLYQSGNNYLWAYIDADDGEVHVYGGFNCNNGTNAINYTGENWYATGSIVVNVTDASGNALFFNDGTDNKTDGNLTISVQ